MKKLKQNFLHVIEDKSGKVAAPILMYVLGVPGLLCVLIWLFFFKGK